MKKKIIFIAGGGTGGHIYPGIAIAEALVRQNPTIEVHFIGTPFGLEREIMKKEGLKLHLLPIGKLNFKGDHLKKIKTLLAMPLAFLKSCYLLLSLRPIFVLGVGGYASGPMVLMASLLRFPTGIWEPNALPGLANRWLAPFVDRGFIVFEGARKYLSCKKIEVLGLPVRSEIEQAYEKNKEKKASSWEDSFEKPFQILVFGGSQGARAINAQIFLLVKKMHQEWEQSPGGLVHKIRIIHQVGKIDWSYAQKFYEGYQDWVTPYEFIFNMPEHYQSSDLAVCRAGANSIAELAAFGLVPILIPLPIADGHQEANAEEVLRCGGGLLIKQKDLNVDTLFFEIQNMMEKEELRHEMSSKLKSLHKPGAADHIADSIFQQVSV
jgi:UDP-N-acetylglucosamine--N-acetylmuramyl-(pentapeptide) pyrophosphoryl-undecaprenol N-acetylglucosamine transferase